MILVIDNYDSFTYNLVQYLGELGAETLVRRNDELTACEALDMGPSGIVIGPGPGRPESAGISNALVALGSGRVPILGVCLGHQAIGQVFGARVVGANRLMHGKTSRIHHDGGDIFSGIESPFVATRYHSLALERDSLNGGALDVCAWTAEGEVMGLVHRDHRTWGVQFHPESILTPDGKTLLGNFLHHAAHERAVAS